MRILMCCVVILWCSLTSAQLAHDRMDVRICGGPEGGVYNEIAKFLTQSIQSHYDGEPLVTEGSWQNLKDLNAGKCEVGIVQADVLNLFLRKYPEKNSTLTVTGGEGLYDEVIHLLCHRETGVRTLDDLIRKTEEGDGPSIYIKGKQSGPTATWRNFVGIDKRLEKVPRHILENPERRDTMYAIKKAHHDRNACVLMVTRAPNLRLEYMSNMARWNKEFQLVNIRNRKIEAYKGAKGYKLYHPVELPRNYYANLRTSSPQPFRLTGNRLSTLGVRAYVVMRTDWYEKNAKDVDLETREFLRQTVQQVKLFLGPGPQKPGFFTRYGNWAAGYRYGKVHKVSKVRVDHFGWLSPFVLTHELELLIGKAGVDGFWYQNDDRQVVFQKSEGQHHLTENYDRAFFQNPWTAWVTGRDVPVLRKMQNTDAYVMFTEDLISLQSMFRNTTFRVHELGLVSALKKTTLNCYGVTPWWFRDLRINRVRRVTIQNAKIVKASFAGVFVKTYEIVLQLAENKYLPISINDTGLFWYAVQNLADNNSVTVKYIERGGADFVLFNKTRNLVFMIQPEKEGVPVMDLETCQRSLE